MSCINCRAPLAAGARFCATCGAPQQPVDAFGPDPRDATLSGGAPTEPPPPGPPSGWVAPGPPVSWPAANPAGPAGPAAGGGSRRRLLVPLGAALVVAVVAAAVLVPRLLGDDGGPAVMRPLAGGADVPLPAGPTGEPEQKWSIDVDLDDPDSSRSMAVGGGRFFAIESSGGDAELVARSLSDGAEVWTDDLPGTAVLLDVEDGPLVQVLGDGSEGELRSYEPGRGDLRWTTAVDEPLYQVFRHGDRLVGSSGAHVVAFRVDTGEEVWSEPIDGIQAEVDGGRVYVADGEEVQALSLDDGKEVWSTDLSDDVDTLVVAGDRVVASAGDVVVGLSAGSGEQAWASDADVGDTGALNAVSGSTLVVTGSDDTVAIDTRTGKVREDRGFDVDEDDWGGIAYGLPGGRILVFDDESGGAVLLDGGSGERIARVDAVLDTMSKSMLFAADEDEGEISAYRVDDLEKAWTLDVDGVAALTVGEGSMVVQTDDGYELWS
jgi:outer membrane protein assembly factor BamB